MSTVNNIQGSAEFSPDLLLRQRLDRWWSDKPRALVCMANPSIAGADKNDPTIWSLIRLLRPLAGCGGFTVVNWLPYIATSPADLHAWRADVWSKRPEFFFSVRNNNTDLIRRLSTDAFIRIVAWGEIVPDVPSTTDVLSALSRDAKENLYCFGTTKSGAPKHPMARGRSRIPDGTRPVIWRQYV